jgi:ATP-dependent RNA helicase SUPV3L1/SUV3
MVEEGPGSVENDLPAAEPQPRHDFSVVQGFQVVDAEDHRLARAGDQSWREALRLELEARAARLHQAVDAAIMLSNDGIIRWLGDPVAKLSLGPNVLSPSAVIFADESLPDASRETIKTRIELWIAATTRRLLAPLFALESIQEGSETVRDLAHELVRSLGVLEREPIKAKIKALTQDDRGELRKQGVRFGAYYIFLPALLKPAGRTLALQLWSLQASGDASELLPTLGSVASSGRTSLPLDKGIWKEGYRVAGYRACGERVVRVDVVERLAGMIRAAIAGEASGAADGAPSQRSPKGFVVSGAMTSLTGCSGEQFASILRSMGFRSVEMKRSDFSGSPSGNEAARQSEAPEAAEVQEPTGDEQAPLPTASEDEAPADSVLAEPVAVPPPDGVVADAEGLNPLVEDAERVPEDADAIAEVADSLTESAEGATEGSDGVTLETTTSPILSDPPDSPAAAEAIERATPPQTSASSCEPAKNADVIVVWRPDHRRVSSRRERESKQSRSEGPSRPDAPGPSPGATPNWRRETVAHPSKRPNRPNLARADEKRRQRTQDYDMAQSAPATAPQQKAKVDPNSPFAKLLELRSLLEEQANKRQ